MDNLALDGIAPANVPLEFEPHFDYRLIASNQVPLGTIIAMLAKTASTLPSPRSERRPRFIASTIVLMSRHAWCTTILINSSRTAT